MENHHRPMTRLLILPGIFALSTLLLYYMITSAPGWVAEDGVSKFELPSQFDNFTVIAQRFREYKNDHFYYITAVFIFTYLYKQTFAIPGSFLLNIIAGSNFRHVERMFGREYVFYYFGKRLTYLQQKIDDNSHRLLPFLLFARMFPISPSWLLNIVAPFLNIPLPIFAFSAFIGLAPYNFICIQAGFMLSELKSWNDVFSTITMLKLCSFALIPLAYAIFMRPRSNRVCKYYKLNF
ncbi:CBN-BUS-19 protein [Aphelenchoides bicaudatus]|nr:CBN-BUS-19 protein [Aphelenchoides bicaudatus]